MTLLEEWRKEAYDANEDPQRLKEFWDDYFVKEKNIYKELLKTPKKAVKGTVKDLADKYGITVKEMTGFLDGINESLKKENPIEEMTEDTEVSLGFDTEKLYKNMVEADAPWLYELEEWNDIYTEDERKELYLAQKKSHTVVNGPKVGRNDPCPCGSGKKYKYCCGRKNK
jgi:uncharacterized protein